MNYEVSQGAESWSVSVREVSGSIYEVSVNDGEPVRIDVAKTPRTVYSLLIGARQYEGSVDEKPDGSFDVNVGTSAFDLSVIDERRKALSVAAAGPSGGRQELRAQMPGKVVKVLVEVGDSVARGDGLVIVEAMKMENELLAEVEGRVTEVHAAEGDTVETDALLVVVEPPEG